jgi:uncharacterized protein (DUF488 family)
VVADETIEVLTIGHSTLPYERFLDHLINAGVTAVADVRTSPFSRHHPHFNKQALRNRLKSDKISYVFLGKELGGRPSDSSFYSNGVADYEKMALSEEFKAGLNRVIEGAKKYRVALMCSEHHPLDCHRCLLVGRALAKCGISVRHILSDGQVVAHATIEDLLLKWSGSSADDLFAPREERLDEAYQSRSHKVAYTAPVHDSSYEYRLE